MNRQLLTIVAFLVAGPAFAQDDRLEAPKTPAEFWRAVTFELNTGKYDSAAYYLKGLLAANPTDQDLVDIEAKDGLAGFIRLRNIVRWSDDAKLNDEAKKNVEEVIKRMNDALEKTLGDSQRIAKYIRNLRGSDEERIFAIRELQRSGMRALPGMAAELRADPDPLARASILNVLPLMPEESVTPLLAALDMPDARLKYQLLESLGQRKDFPYLPGRVETNPLPTLDFLAASPKESAEVRQLARDLIVKLRPIGKSEIRPAKQELTDAAWKFYRHQERFVKPAAVPVWRWDDNQLVQTPSNASQAEEYYGLRYARWALELDPDYLPAQVAFLSMAVDKAFERAGLEADLAKAAPAVHDLLGTASAATLIATLDQALIDKRTPVVLGVTQVLGARGEITAGQATRYRPSVLQRALEYPDRRVQLAAAEALIRIPTNVGQQHQSKIVETLRRTLAAETEATPTTTRRAVLGFFDLARGREIGEIFTTAGFDVVFVRTGKDLQRRLVESNDVDAVVIDAAIPNPMLPELLASLRADARTSTLPIRVIHQPTDLVDQPSTMMEARMGKTTPQTTIIRNGEVVQEAEKVNRLRRLTDGMKNVTVLTTPLSPLIIQASFAQEATADQEVALTPAERKRFALKAIELFQVIAHRPGFDLEPANRTIRQALKNNDLAKPAIDVVTRLPGREAQIDLASVVLDAARPAELRLAATDGLMQHMQRFGVALTDDTKQGLLQLAADEKTPELRGRVADAVGVFSPNAKATGDRLREYQAPRPGAAIPIQGKPAVEPEKKPEEPEKKPDEKPDGN